MCHPQNDFSFILCRTPQDFPKNDCEKNFKDRAFPQDLTELGKLVMGFSKFEFDPKVSTHDGAKDAVDYANRVLFK